MSSEAPGSDRLTGGLVHDFNNQLTILLGCALIVSGELPPDHPLNAKLQEISEAAAQAGTLARQILALSQPGGDMPTIDLNYVVLRVEELLRALLPASIRIVSSLGAQERKVRADPGLIEQVIVNLARNAADAMPVGGTLHIETSRLAVTDEFAALSFAIPQGDYQQLAISDTGLGMTPDVRGRAFEPLFTTRTGSPRAGLGLSTVYALVSRSGGFTSVHSAPGLGTTFRVLFPAIEDAVPVRNQAIPIDSGGNETILLVEDDARLRNYLGRILAASGYFVLRASDPMRALQFSETHENPIGLLVSDFLLPGMSGVELAGLVKALRPSIRILLMSGYAELEGRRGEKKFPFIQKPFTPSELLLRVRTVLDAANRSISDS